MKASRAAASWAVLAKSLGERIFFCTMEKMIECFFSVITRQAIRRGSFTSVKELVAVIGAFTGSWNDHPRPFAWTKDADKEGYSRLPPKVQTNNG
jgi:hypothetical protein